MTNEDAVVLAKEGDVESIEWLWNRNQGVIRKGIKPFVRNERDAEDYSQEAYFALLRAIKAFCPDVPVKFTTYLTRAIRWYLIRLITQADPIGSLTLNIPANEDSDTEKVDLIKDPNAEDPEERAEKDELRRVLDEALDRLPARPAACIRGVYFHGRMQHLIAQQYGVSHSQISMDVQNGLTRLRLDRSVQDVAAEYIGAYYGVGVGAFKNNNFTSSTERLALKHIEAEEKHNALSSWFSSWEQYWTNRATYNQAYKRWISKGRPQGEEPTEPEEPQAVEQW